ncbi:hypothetical protein [Sulfurimonas sp.]|uniref:hypothetical protein n=1 Tax=Sulfurimonas sp. TaxID=2022749 RepID=UPI002B46A275|nr:hypothetical protein [Sulfurimonas sp.]
MNKKILIIGINGFLGRELKCYLSDLNFNVYGTSHNQTDDSKVIRLRIGDSFNNELLSNKFDVVVYLAHSYNKSNNDKFINWYKNIFSIFQQRVDKQIYISSYSANEFATSNYGRIKYTIEKFFLQNGGYSISPGLIIGDGGIYKKIEKLVNILPVIFIPKYNNSCFLPIVPVKTVCNVISKIINYDYKIKNYDIYTEKISLKKLAKDIASKNKKLRFIYFINARFVLYIMLIFEKLGLKLPVTSDSLEGFIANQAYHSNNELNIFLENQGV